MAEARDASCLRSLEPNANGPVAVISAIGRGARWCGRLGALFSSLGGGAAGVAAGVALGIRLLCGITGRNNIRPPPGCGVDAREDDGEITEEPALLGTILVVRLGAAGVLRLCGSSLMAKSGKKETRIT